MADHYERHDSRFLLNKVMEHYIRQAARTWKDGRRPLPSYSTIAECLSVRLPEELGMLTRLPKAKDFAFSAENVLEQICRRTDGLFDTADSNALLRLLSQNLILDVSHFGKPEIAYFLLWLIAFLQRHARQQGWMLDSRLRLFILLDDLQQLLACRIESPLPTMLTTLRQRGIHLCSMIHNFNRLAAIAKGNVDLVCHVGPLADNDDRRAFLDWAGMRASDDTVRQYFGAIPKGQGAIRHITKHLYARPMSVRYHEIRKRDPDEAALKQLCEAALAGINYQQPLTLEDLLADVATTAAVSTGMPADDATRLRLFLESIAAPLGWKKPQREHLMAAGVGNSKELRERLLRQSYGLAQSHSGVNAGRGSGITLYELTPAGWTFLQRTPLPIPGKGSLPHKYYQNRTAEALRAALAGYPDLQLEYKIGRHFYDLMQASPDGRLIGIEIAASDKDRNEADNAIDGFLPHTDRIHRHVILAATEGAYSRAKHDIDVAVLLQPIRSRISVERIGEVWSKTAAFVTRWLA